jgi:hypothetical protein
VLPEPAFPNSDLTAVSFIVIFDVDPYPSSVLTWLKEIVLPDDGSAILSIIN